MLKERGESEHLLIKVKKELLPCLRSFTSGLRVAEDVWMQGMLIKEYPPEASTIKCIEDSWALLKTEDGQARSPTLDIYKIHLYRFEGYLRAWMNCIGELLNESEQLRVETDDSGPQARIARPPTFHRMKLSTGSQEQLGLPFSQSKFVAMSAR